MQDCEFYDRLKTICESKGLTVTKACRLCGISSGTPSGWKDGSSPKLNNVIALVNFLNISLTELIPEFNDHLGISSNNILPDDEEKLLTFYRLLSDENKALINNTIETRLPHRSIDRCKDKVSAGFGFDLATADKELIEVLSDETSKRANYTVIAEGDSMSPIYDDGDTLLVDKNVDANPGQIGIFVINGERGYVKRLGDHCLISENKIYNPIIIGDSDTLECKGLVLGKATVLTHVSN